MSGSRVTLEWQFGETVDWEDTTESLRAPPSATPQSRRATLWLIRHWRRAATVIVALLLVLSATVYALVRRAEANLTAIENEIKQALVDEALIAASVEDLDSQPLVPTIEDLELQGDIAIVRLLAAESDDPWRPAPYRMTRFFRATLQSSGGQSWTPIDAEPSFWGNALTRDTQHFHFAYRQRDAKAVEALADELETLYARLLDDAGLASARSDSKRSDTKRADAKLGGARLIIEVAPRADDRMRDHLLQTSFWDGRLLVPSPLLVLPPASMSDAQALHSAVAAPLASWVLDEALATADMSCVWNQAAGGLALWWRESNSTLPSMTRYRRNNTLHNWVSSTVPPTLRNLTGDVRDCRQRQILAENIRALRTLGAKTVFEYMAATYSAADGTHPWLAPLIEALQAHESWDTLIPAVLHISADEFDADWQAYIVATYGSQSQSESAALPVR